MPEATFIKSYDYHVPGRPIIKAYPAGYSGSIPQAHVDAAREAGVLAEEPKNDNGRPAK